MIESSAFGTLKAKYLTFGCKLNFAETSSIASVLEHRGISSASEEENPDIIIVNTCSVTSVADRKCRQAIRTLGRRYPEAAIFVTGCYAQLKPDEVSKIPGVQMVIGNDRKSELPDLLDAWRKDGSKAISVKKASEFTKFEHSCSRGNRTRYFLKVQDGCNYFCSYCTIPFARGRSRSPQISELIDYAGKTVEAGGKEIVLTGVNIGDFGRNHKETFLDLLKELEKVDGILRYRISSIEPNLLTDEILEFVAKSEKFMPHFHIPLQSGDDAVLELMRRHYDTVLFRDKIERIRSLIPDAFIGVDLITGMRGETPERFENSYRFIESLDITRLHVFSYSEREGTAALKITPIVSQEEKKERTRRMIDLSESKEKKFSERFMGTCRPVLFETYDPKMKVLTGHTDNYIKVAVTHGTVRLINNIVDVRMGESHRDKFGDLYSYGEIL